MKVLKSLLAVAAVAAAGLAQAGEIAPFTAEKFAAAKASGNPVVLDVHATWCPTCKKQQPVLEQLVGSDKYKDYTMLVIDYDDQKAVRKSFHVSQQSTLLVFKGEDEKARATGITTPEAIGALLDKGL